MKTLSILVLLLLVGGTSQACLAGEGQNESRTEAEIWALEAKYVSGFRDAAYHKVIPMWDSGFIGWPASEALPTDKKGVIDYLKRVAPLPGAWSFEIERAGIRITGNVAITHFTLHTKSDAAQGAGYESATRVTHTWINADAGWKILSGMSARK